MTVVFVHGNPEASTVWDQLVDALELQDVVGRSPPVFGAPRPTGWRGTPTAYRDWLIGQPETIGTPIHLVGHDWCDAHVVNVAIGRPDLLRSRCSDALGWSEPDYTRHALARTWQTAGVGKSLVTEVRRSAAKCVPPRGDHDHCGNLATAHGLTAVRVTDEHAETSMERTPLRRLRGDPHHMANRS